MNKYIIILFILFISCKGRNVETNSKKNTSEIIKAPDYELVKSEIQNGILILFPCFPCDI
jgi:tRNA 2-selenouridine synthase SelU